MNYAVYKTRFDLERHKFVWDVLAVFAEESDAQVFVDAINPKIMPDFVQIMPIAP